MNKLFDVMVVVVVFVFAALLVMTLMRTCRNTKAAKKDPILESSVKMGEDGLSADTTLSGTEVEEWDEDIARNDTSELEADGINPEDISTLDPEVASEISEHGDEGIKEEKKEAVTPPDVNDDSKINISPGGDIFIVIAGSFKDPGNANNLVSTLKKHGYPAEVVQFLNNDFRSVAVQRFDSKAGATKIVSELKRKHKIESYVVKRKE